MDNIVHDLNNDLFPNGDYSLEVKHSHENVWYLYVSKLNSNRRAKVEIILEIDYNHPEDTGVVASVLRHGSVSRATMALIMDALLARI